MKAAVLANLFISLVLAIPVHGEEHISYGRFKDVVLYEPKGEVKEFVLFLSGDGGWNQGVVGMAQALVEEGAMVAGVSVPQLVANLEADSDDCVFPDGDLENLSHYLQGYAKLPTYFTPLLVGYSSGATLAYGMLAQAPTGTFAGAISLGFCPNLELKKPLCKGEGVHFTQRKDGKGVDLLPTKKLRVPWVVLHGEQDEVCATPAAKVFAAEVPAATLVLLPNVGHGYAVTKNWMPQFLAAFHSLTATRAASVPAPPSSLKELPIVEVPASGKGDTFAVLLSGDGGWAGLDKDVAAALAAKGVPVAGLDSLRYFWTPRTPQGLADDLDRVLHYYAVQWKKSRAVLIGYSMGADVLPFAVNRLPTPSKARVALTVMMGPGEKASFEFRLGNWLSEDASGVPVLPEAKKLTAATALCLYGRDEDASLCPQIPATAVHAQALPGGHHFNGAYERLATLILARINPP